MNFISKDGESLKIEITKDDLLLICNALNEVCHGVDIDEWDFKIRLGVPKSECELLLKQCGALFDDNFNQKDES